MPTSSGQYVGDRATVLPDNTAALLHFSNQFSQLEAQRRAEKAAQQKAEQERVSKGVSYINNALDPKNFKGADLAQRGINENLSDKMNELLQWRKSNPGADDIDLAQQVQGAVKDIKSYADLTNEIQKSITDANSRHIDDPGIDSGMGADLMLHDALFTTDEYGNKVLNKSPKARTGDEYYADLLKNHPDKVILPGDPTLRKLLVDAHTQEENIPDTYDTKGNRTFAGGTVKVPYYGAKTFDEKGNLKGVKVRTTPYKLNGQTISEPDANGKLQPVEVVDDEMYNSLMSKPSSISAGVNLELKRRYPDVEEDSAMADMLRKKILTEKIGKYGDWAYKPNEDQTAKLKNQLRDDARAEEQLRLAREDNHLAREKFNFDKKKDEKKNLTIDDITPLTESIGNAVGEKHKFLDGKERTFIPLNKIDAQDLEMITGNHKTESGEVKYVDPIEVTREDGTKDKGFYMDDEGNWEGQKPKTTGPKDRIKIYKARVADAQLKYYTKDDLPASSKGTRGPLGTIGRIIQRVMPKPKTKGKFDNL